MNACLFEFTCLCTPFVDMVDVRQQLVEWHGPQGEPWQRIEYDRAHQLAHLRLPFLFDTLPSDDIERISWCDIAEDVRDLSTLERNP